MSGANRPNESEQPGEMLDPVVFDRLVDGELPEAERHNLLASLDRRPSGWRECALAFLEAQSWGELFPAAAKNLQVPDISREEVVASRSAGAVPVAAAAIANAETQLAAQPALIEPVRQHRPAPRWLWMVEMAAGFLIALSLGFWIRGGMVRTMGPPTGSLVQSRVNPNGIPAYNEASLGRVQQVSIPLVDSRQMEAWRSQPMASVPDEVRKAAENTGFQIRQVRRYLQVPVPGGQAVVPIDQIEIIPAGNRGMQ